MIFNSTITMNNIIQRILREHFEINDTVHFTFKLFKDKKVSTKKVRGSVRSQMGKIMPYDQFDLNKKEIEANPLP